jgi:DHA2 family multidrug resistance protein
LGGFLVDGLGWQWIFFVNIPFGILAVAMSWLFLPKDQSKNKARNQAVDWLGIGLLIIAVGCMQTVLEEGEKEEWFSSGFITSLAIASVIGLALFIWWELKVAYPAVDLRVLRHRSLAAGSFLSALVGMGLYGALFVVPIFTQSILRFTATQTGLLLAPGALASAIVMVMLGKLSTKVDARILIAIGAVGTASVMFDLSKLTIDTGTDDLFWPLIWRGAFTVLMFLPLSLATLGPLPKQDISAGSGFYNLTRQLGGSIGIALLTTILDKREAFHQAILSANLSPYNPQTNERLNMLQGALQAQGIDAATAGQQALALLQQTVNTQAAVLSFADIFRVVGVAFLCSLPLLLFLGKGGAGAKAPVGH